MSHRRDDGQPRIVLVVQPQARHGGIQEVVRRLAMGLPAHGIEVTTVLVGDTPPGVAARFEESGVAVEIHPDMGAAATWRRFRAWRRCVREHRPTLVVPHYGEPVVPLRDVMAVRSTRTAIAPVLHSAAPVRTGFPVRWAFRLARAVGVISQQQADDLLTAGASSSDIHVLQNGTPRVQRRSERDGARHGLGLPLDAPVVAMAARLVRNKGAELLVEACSRIESGTSPVHLVVAGGGGRRFAAEQRAASSMPGRVRFLGWVDDLADLYAAADVWAIPSLLEAVPLVAFEAAHHGLPVVASDVGAIREAIIDGETGILVPPDDPDALAGALGRLLRDPAERTSMGLRARDRAVAGFSSEMMVSRHAAFLSAAMTPAARRGAAN